MSDRPETYNLAPWPNETGYDATPTLRCGWCNGVGNMKPLPREYEEGSLEPGFLPPAVICPRCKGSGLDPDCTKEEIGKGVRLSKSPATKWYVTEYPQECDFAITDGNEILVTIIGGNTIGDQCDLASRIAKLPDLERELAEAIDKYQSLQKTFEEWQLKFLSEQAELLHNKDVERDKLFDEAYQIRIERDEAQEKYDKLATEHMLAVNKLCEERDEAREQVNRYRYNLDLLPIKWDI